MKRELVRVYECSGTRVCLANVVVTDPLGESLAVTLHDVIEVLFRVAVV